MQFVRKLPKKEGKIKMPMLNVFNISWPQEKNAGPAFVRLPRSKAGTSEVVINLTSC